MYFSVDVEADGPIPGPYSMLSIGSAAYDERGLDRAHFYRNIRPLDNATTHPKQDEFWEKFPKQLADTKIDPLPALTVMGEFKQHIEGVCGDEYRPVFVAYPAGFDFTFIYWYFMNFLDECPFGFSAFDIKTAASLKLELPFTQAFKKNFRKEWKTPNHNNHNALYDAVQQGEIFCKMMGLRNGG